MRKRGFFIKKTKSILLFSAVFCITMANVYANESVGHENHASESKDTVSAVADSTHAIKHGEEESFNPGEMILHHIGDAHEWHLWGHTSIGLPVILYTDKGIETFSSSKFHHGDSTYTGKHYTYSIEHEHIKVVNADGSINEEASKNITDLSITRNVASMFLSITILLLIFTSVAKAYKKREGKAPKGFQSLIEPIIIFVRDEIAKPNLGYKYARFMPFLLTIFFFIWVNNLIGLVPFFPGGANLTGNIAFTLVMGVITFIVTNVNGNKTYWQHVYAPHVPKALWPIMIPVEIIGLLAKPFALIVRLFANITAGHIIVLSLISLIFIFKSLAIAPVSVAFVIFMDVLELLVAFLQAFIFTMLTALFIGTAISEEHGDHSHSEEHH
jgi:F-type H+-transporting ATPase subunit a